MDQQHHGPHRKDSTREDLHRTDLADPAALVALLVASTVATEVARIMAAVDTTTKATATMRRKTTAVPAAVAVHLCLQDAVVPRPDR